MVTRTVCAAIAAAALASTTSAQTSRDGAPQLWQQMSQRNLAAPTLRMPLPQSQTTAVQTNGSVITIIGCLEREEDYRERTRAGKGGKLGTGAGLGNEYVLVTGAGGCSSTSGDAFELTGSEEKNLEPFVGLPVEISGQLKDSTLDANGRPTGGFDPLGQDLRLREVEVASFREPIATAAPARSARAEQPRSFEADRAPSAAPQDVQQERPAATTGADDTLPRTASPLAAAGLLGLAALGGVAGLRATRALSRKRLIRR